jgi:hypothetical protein
MKQNEPNSWNSSQRRRLSRRALIRGAAGTMLGASFFYPTLVNAQNGNGAGADGECFGPNPIPGGITALKPFGIFVHHNPLNPATPLANINDPSQITDFDGFVGQTHIRGGGTGIDTATGTMTRLAFQADMGFSQGRFIGTDGHQHQGTFAFV